MEMRFSGGMVEANDAAFENSSSKDDQVPRNVRNSTVMVDVGEKKPRMSEKDTKKFCGNASGWLWLCGA